MQNLRVRLVAWLMTWMGLFAVLGPTQLGAAPGNFKLEIRRQLETHGKADAVPLGTVMSLAKRFGRSLREIQQELGLMDDLIRAIKEHGAPEKIPSGDMSNIAARNGVTLERAVGDLEFASAVADPEAMTGALETVVEKMTDSNRNSSYVIAPLTGDPDQLLLHQEALAAALTKSVLDRLGSKRAKLMEQLNVVVDKGRVRTPYSESELAAFGRRFNARYVVAFHAGNFETKYNYSLRTWACRYNIDMRILEDGDLVYEATARSNFTSDGPSGDRNPITVKAGLGAGRRAFASLERSYPDFASDLALGTAELAKTLDSPKASRKRPGAEKSGRCDPNKIRYLPVGERRRRQRECR